MIIIRLAIVFVLMVIFLQDIRSRSVQWFWFPITFMLLIVEQLQHAVPLKEILADTGLNIAFLLVQLLLLSGYFSLKYRKLVNITKAGLLGWGDILLLMSIAVYLSILNFVFFYIVSLLISLLTWLLYQFITGKKNKQIPLAGLQAVFFVLFLGSYWCFNKFNLHQDTWLLSFIT